MRAVRPPPLLPRLGLLRTALVAYRKETMTQPESRLSRKIITELTKYGVFAFKIHGGPHMMAGLPDIIACVGGKFVGLETKTPSGGDATPIQQFVHSKIRKAGGTAIVVRSVDEAFAACGLVR